MSRRACLACLGTGAARRTLATCREGVTQAKRARAGRGRADRPLRPSCEMAPARSGSVSLFTRPFWLAPGVTVIVSAPARAQQSQPNAGRLCGPEAALPPHSRGRQPSRHVCRAGPDLAWPCRPCPGRSRRRSTRAGPAWTRPRWRSARSSRCTSRRRAARTPPACSPRTPLRAAAPVSRAARARSCHASSLARRWPRPK